MDSAPGSSVHSILQTRILERLLFASSGYIFQTQGSNCHLHWQMESLPLSHQGSSVISWLLVKSIATVHIMRTTKHSSLRSQTEPHDYHSFLTCPLSWNWQSYCLRAHLLKFYELTFSQMLLHTFCKSSVQFSSVQLLSHVQLFATPWTAACQASLSITNSWSLLNPMSIELVMPSNQLILHHPLLLPSIFPSIRVFSNKSVLRMRWPKYWSFSFSISPSNEYLGLISFRIDWLDLQRTLKSLQHHSSKASILRCSAFFIFQLSHPYTTTGKTIALTRRTFASKVMSLLFHMLSRLVIVFLPRSKHLLISCLQWQSALILEPKKIVSYCFCCFPIYLPWSDGTRCHHLSFLNVEF